MLSFEPKEVNKEPQHLIAVYDKQVEMLYSSSNLTAIAHGILATLFIYIMKVEASQNMLFFWYCSMLVLFLFRGYLTLLYNKHHKGVSDSLFWGRLFILATFVVGMGWGIGSIIFFLDHNILNQLTIAFVMFGIASAGLTVLSVVPSAFYALLTPITLPILFMTSNQNSEGSFSIFLISLLGSVFLLRSAKLSYKNTFDNIDMHIKEVENKEQLVNAKIEAENANQAKSEFLSRMSHELRTPLNAILGFTQLLDMDKDSLNPEQTENVNEVLKAGEHLLHLINEVLDLARIESGKIEISMQEVDLNDILQQSILLIKSQADSKGIRIIDELKIKTHKVYADPMRLKQVLTNLLSNAVKYNREQGSITLDSEIHDSNKIRINITDTGHGFNEQEKENLFIPFDRLNMSNTIEGTGIGLVITRYLIEMMDAKLGAESSVGKGSCFWVQFNSVSESHSDEKI